MGQPIKGSQTQGSSKRIWVMSSKTSEESKGKATEYTYGLTSEIREKADSQKIGIRETNTLNLKEYAYDLGIDKKK